jgi:hypothetical protein
VPRSDCALLPHPRRLARRQLPVTAKQATLDALPRTGERRPRRPDVRYFVGHVPQIRRGRRLRCLVSRRARVQPAFCRPAGG